VSGSQHGNSARRDSGFTLLELVVAMSVLAILLAIGTPAWMNYGKNQDARSAARATVSVLRNAQVRAVAEEVTYRVDIDSTARTLQTYRCQPGTVPLACTLKVTKRLDGSSVRITSAAFTNSSGASTASAYFYARGTASPGTVVIQRTGRPVRQVVEVEGLTGRVSY
jgi:prepilin-type N-terminal cleavage/methylation domain-containing protein